MNRIVQMSWPIRRRHHIIIITYQFNGISSHRIIINDRPESLSLKPRTAATVAAATFSAEWKREEPKKEKNSAFWDDAIAWNGIMLSFESEIMIERERKNNIFPIKVKVLLDLSGKLLFISSARPSNAETSITNYQKCVCVVLLLLLIKTNPNV